MTFGQGLDLLMVVGLCVATLGGFPIAFTLAGTALIFAGIGYAMGAFDPSFLGFFPNRIYGVMTNEVLIAVPLFVFMGVMLERSKVAEELLDTMIVVYLLKTTILVFVALIGVQGLSLAAHSVLVLAGIEADARAEDGGGEAAA